VFVDETESDDDDDDDEEEEAEEEEEEEPPTVPGWFEFGASSFFVTLVTFVPLFDFFEDVVRFRGILSFKRTVCFGLWKRRFKRTLGRQTRSGEFEVGVNGEI